MVTTIVLLSLALWVSISVNVALMWYASRMVKKWFLASEAASEIFTRFDAYRTHLQSIYELQMFYGDRNLREIIEHTKNMVQYLQKFNGIYSFTQPELEEALYAEEQQDAKQTSTEGDESV